MGDTIQRCRSNSLFQTSRWEKSVTVKHKRVSLQWGVMNNEWMMNILNIYTHKLKLFWYLWKIFNRHFYHFKMEPLPLGGFWYSVLKKQIIALPRSFHQYVAFVTAFSLLNKINYIVNVVQLDPANSNSFILNSLLFQTQNYFPWIWSFSYALISISKSQFLELFFFLFSLRVWNSGSVNWMKITEVVIFWVK